MKNLLLGTFLTLAINIKATPTISDTIIDALKVGNSETLSSYFDTSVDLTIASNEGVYSKTQAELILKTFFSENEPSDFEIVHNGDAKNNTYYTIGNLATKKGVYRVYILYNKKKDEEIIFLELRIEPSE